MKSLDLMIQINQSILEEKRMDLALILDEETSLENIKKHPIYLC